MGLCGSRALTGQDCEDLLDEPDDGADRDLRTGLRQLLRDRELESVMEESAEGGSLTPMDGTQQSGEGAGYWDGGRGHRGEACAYGHATPPTAYIAPPRESSSRRCRQVRLVRFKSPPHRIAPSSRARPQASGCGPWLPSPLRQPPPSEDKVTLSWSVWGRCAASRTTG